MTSDEWFNVLRQLGVKEAPAQKFAPAFEHVLKPGAFSRGAKELLDFVPTVLVESQMLERTVENGRYTAKRIRELGNASAAGSRWRSLVPRADEIANNEYKFFEACYGGRMGNGPEGSGDGARYKGRGPIMVTGRDGYVWLGKLMGQDLQYNETLLEGPYFGTEGALHWWEGRVPDAYLGDTKKIRKVVNGGYFGLQEVEHMAAKVRQLLA